MTAALWTAFLTNFLFWTGLSAGAVAFAALLHLTGAEWAAPLHAMAHRFDRFLLPSIVVCVVLLAGGRALYPWTTNPNASPWLRLAPLAVRDVASLAAIAACAMWLRAVMSTRAAVVFLIVYAVGFSVIAIDLVMSIDAPWTSTLFPAYLVTVNVYAAIAAVALAAVWNAPAGELVLTEARACDLGKLLFGFALLWMYLVWSQYFAIWYGNLTEEVGYVAARWYGPWRPLTVLTVVTRFALPFVVLLPRAGKTRVPVLLVSAAVAAGFWAECFLLVAPSTRQVPAIWSAVLVTAAFAVVFVLSVQRRPASGSLG